MTLSWLSNFCFGSSTNLTQIKHPLCESDKININELFVRSKYGSWRPSLTTVVFLILILIFLMCTILQKLKLLTPLLAQLQITVLVNIAYNTIKIHVTVYETEVNST